VLFPSGVFSVGAIALHSHVWLRVAKGATLSFSWEEDAYVTLPHAAHPSAAAYPPPPHGQRVAMAGRRSKRALAERVEGASPGTESPLPPPWRRVRAVNRTDVGISGGGVLEGNGANWHLRLSVKAPECAGEARGARGHCAARLKALREPQPPLVVGFYGCEGATVSRVRISGPVLHVMQVNMLVTRRAPARCCSLNWAQAFSSVGVAGPHV
jgi:polygalacturonase